ncbi:MAG: InlB B-repeat-containing protein [Bacteroidales bacterium]
MKKYFKFMTAALFMASTLLVGCDKDEVYEKKYALTLTASPEEGGTVEGQGEYPKGKKVKVVATTNAGYKFDGWYDGNQKLSGNETYSFTVAKKLNLEAKFTKRPTMYTLKLTAEPTGYGKVEGYGRIDSGRQVMAKAIANERYKFIAWTEGEDTVSHDEKYYFQLTGDRTLVAHFETIDMYGLELKAEVGGTVEGGGAAFLPGEEVTVKAIPNEGYRFVGWYDKEEKVSEDEIYTFNIKKSFTLTAKFKLLPIIISDANFLAYLLEQGFVKPEVVDEISTHVATTTGKELKELNVVNKGIENLAGILLFPKLTSLNCQRNNLKSLDVSTLNLATLTCSYNKLTELKLPQNPSLNALDCSNNLLTELKISTFRGLGTLYCNNNQLTSLELTNTSLSILHCYSNRMSTLDATSVLLSVSNLELKCGMQKTIDGSKDEILKLKLTSSGVEIWENTPLFMFPENKDVELEK